DDQRALAPAAEEAVARHLVGYHEADIVAHRLHQKQGLLLAVLRHQPDSGGNQQKVVFARWQARGPAVLILDEPTRGIDVGAKAEIYRLIESLADQGLAILLISSEMPELLGLADRILVMQSGSISGELPWQEASEEAVLALAMRSDKKAIERRVS
ncbi:MAG: sugar ABC transporter ATP-binding protein, partial [Mesorhizobium sp.]